MKMTRFTRNLSLLLAMTLLAALLPFSSALAEADGMVRVKLTRLGSPTKITFTTSCP